MSRADGYAHPAGTCRRACGWARMESPPMTLADILERAASALPDAARDAQTEGEE